MKQDEGTLLTCDTITLCISCSLISLACLQMLHKPSSCCPARSSESTATWELR